MESLERQATRRQIRLAQTGREQEPTGRAVRLAQTDGEQFAAQLEGEGGRICQPDRQACASHYTCVVRRQG